MDEAPTAAELADLRRRADAGDVDVQVYLGQALVETGTPAYLNEGRRWLALAAQAGDGDAYSHLGLSYIVTAGEAGDLERGRVLLEQGAGMGNAACLYNLGVVYHQGAGVEPDIARAIEYWKKAATGGNGGAAYNLSVAYAKGIGVAVDLRAALPWADLAGQLGDGRGEPYARAIRRELGLPEKVSIPVSTQSHADLLAAIAREQVRQNFEGSALQAQASAPAAPPAPTLESRALAGDPTAQLELAIRLRDARDFAGAIGWFEKVAAHGSVLAHMEAGNYYLKKAPYAAAGDTRPLILHKARDHFAAAVRAGLAEARPILAQVEDAILAALKEEKAWHQAAAAGDVQARYRLGMRLLEGSQAPADVTGALAELEQAARLGHALAATTLFKLFEAGAHGVRRDPARALAMLVRAAELGDGDAIFMFVRRYADGRITDAALPDAATLFAKCRRMYPDYRAPGVPPRAPQELHAEAKKGDLESTYLLAMAFYEGAGLERSLEKSLQCLRIAADKGYAPAQIELARRYARGEGVPQDIAAGRPLAIAAAKQGHIEARAELAMFGAPQGEIDAILNPWN